MATTLSIETFSRVLKGKSFDIKTASADSRLKQIDFRKVDLNNDGKVSGDKEFTSLFYEIERFDKNKKICT